MAGSEVDLISRHESALRVQFRVIFALMLRDMRTRFGNKLTGYLVIVGLPFTHALFLMIGYYVMNRVAPIGTSVDVFIGTGVIPYIVCLYPCRMMMLCLAQNQTLMNFPIVKSIDIIIARGALEIITAFWVVALLCLVLYVTDADFLPQRPEEAILATLATIYFGFALGFVSAIMYKLARAWLGVQIVLFIILYFGSGALHLPTALPQKIRDIMWFNPLFHSVEWLRSAYYEGYGYGTLNKEYLVGVATVVLFLGLAMERGVRGRLMESN